MKQRANDVRLQAAEPIVILMFVFSYKLVP